MTKTWHHIRHKGHGEQRFVWELPQDLAEWEVTELDREPDEDDEFDAQSKKLKKNLGRKKARERHHRASAITLADLLERIEALELQIVKLENKK